MISCKKSNLHSEKVIYTWEVFFRKKKGRKSKFNSLIPLHLVIRIKKVISKYFELDKSFAFRKSNFSEKKYFS